MSSPRLPLIRSIALAVLLGCGAAVQAQDGPASASWPQRSAASWRGAEQVPPPTSAPARAALDAAQRRVSNLSRQIEVARQSLAQANSRMANDDAAAAKRKAELDRANADLERLRPQSDLTSARCRAAQAALNQARDAASGNAQQTVPATQPAAPADSAAKDELHLAESTATQRLAASDEYHRAYATWDAVDRRVQSLRQQNVSADSSEMKDAVAARRAARAAIEEMRQRALDADPAVLAARDRVARSAAPVGPMASADEQNAVGAAASVSTLEADFRSAQSACASIAKAMDDAEKRRADAQAAYQLQIDASRADRQQAAQAQREIDALQADFSIAQAEVASAQTDLNRAVALNAQSQTEREQRQAAPPMENASRYYYSPPPRMSYGPTTGGYENSAVYIAPPLPPQPAPPAAPQSQSARQSELAPQLQPQQLQSQPQPPPAFPPAPEGQAYAPPYTTSPASPPAYPDDVEQPYEVVEPYAEWYGPPAGEVIVRAPIPFWSDDAWRFRENRYRSEIIRRREWDYPRGQEFVRRRPMGYSSYAFHPSYRQRSFRGSHR